jgi:ATP-binding cassette, subfamily B, bacterial HlyB/CyaB
MLASAGQKVAMEAIAQSVADPLSGDLVQSPWLGCLALIGRQHGLDLTVQQLIHDNVLTDPNVTIPQVLKCAKTAGLKAKWVQLDWDGLGHLRKALPAIVVLKNGECMVLVGWNRDQVVLQHPNAGTNEVTVDRVRFEDAWTEDVIVVRRNYDLTDEEQPFGIGYLAALILREKKVFRDIVICSFMLGLLAIWPIAFWRLLIDKVLYYQTFNTFYVLCVVFGVLLIWDTIFSWVRRWMALQITYRVDAQLATYAFEKVLNLPIDFFERTHVGRIAHDVIKIWKLRMFLIEQFFGTFLDLSALIFFIPVMLFFSVPMTSVVLAMCAFVIVWVIVMMPYYRRRATAAEKAESERAAFLVQTLHGIRTVKSLSLEARQRHLWDVHSAKCAKLFLAEGKAGNLIQTVIIPAERLAVSGSLALGVYLVLASKNPMAYMGALFAFIMLAQRVAAPLTNMGSLIHEIEEARIAVNLVGRLVNQLPEEGRSGRGIRAPISGHVQFLNLSFTYAGAPAPALQKLTFEISQGTTLGIMGRSGSGKTTITRLLQRLHSDYSGLIKIDGVDVREYDVDHLRRSIGVVLQENFLFSGTIRENLAAAKPDATFDEVVRVARLAGAEEFIDKLPRGYETHIYEGSPNLSGGQRQRLAIARALIVDPPILILDEATSSLDAESEAIVNANLARIARGRTMIIVSHRLSSLVNADAILVLERGTVVDIGRHGELLERCDIYSDLWYEQSRHVISPPASANLPHSAPRSISSAGTEKSPVRSARLVS